MIWYTAAMTYTHTVRGERFVFADLAELLARANEPKSGDLLADIAARSERERVAPHPPPAPAPPGPSPDTWVTAPPAAVSPRLTLDTPDRAAFEPFRGMAVGEFREWLLAADGAAIRAARWAITPEMAAAA